MAERDYYSDDEAEQILRLASRRTTEGVSRERLREMASELGISPDALRSAEEQIFADREEKELRRDFDKFRRRRLIGSLWSFVSVNAFLLFLDYRKDHAFGWSLWVVGLWGVGILSQIFSALSKSTDSYETEFRNWREGKHENADGVAVQIATSETRQRLEQSGAASTEEQTPNVRQEHS